MGTLKLGMECPGKGFDGGREMGGVKMGLGDRSRDPVDGSSPRPPPGCRCGDDRSCPLPDPGLAGSPDRRRGADRDGPRPPGLRREPPFLLSLSLDL